MSKWQAMSDSDRRMIGMSSTSDFLETSASAVERLARAQAAIRALIGQGGLTQAERLELAEWQREWVAAWREAEYVTAA
jgi:hypothetical protein